MEFRNKVLPLVLSGTLAFGSMGVPMTAFASAKYKVDASKSMAQVEKELAAKVKSGDITQAEMDSCIAQYKAEVKKQNAAAEAQMKAQADEAAAESADPAPGDSGSDPASGGNAGASGDTAGDASGEGSGSGDGDGDAAGTSGGKSDGGGPAAEPGGTGESGGSGKADGTADGAGTGDADAPGSPDDDAVNADQAAAEAVIAAIAKLPDTAKVTAGDQKAVKVAQEGYRALTVDQRKLVDAASVARLADAVNALAALDVAAPGAGGAAAEAADDGADAGDAAQAAAKPASAEEQAAAGAQAWNATRTASVAASGTYQSSYSGQGYTRMRYSANLSTEMFIASIGEQARQIGQEKNLYASVMIAQAVIESDSGNSGLAKAPNNNLFGIKGAYNGQSVSMSTQEDDGLGKLYTIQSDFRKYDSQRESLADYADLLRGNMNRYHKAWKENAPTYEDAARALQGTYATSTIYADSICAVIEAYDLTRFDEPLDFEIVGTAADGRALTMDDYANLEANATSFLGTPYVWGGTTPSGFDCSGFVQYLYKETFGIQLPRTTYAQQHEGVEVPFSDLQMGDLLFFVNGGSTEHVAMYLGDGFYIHAPEKGDVIKISDMESYTPSFAKRIITTTQTPAAAKGATAGKHAAATVVVPTAEEDVPTDSGEASQEQEPAAASQDAAE